MKLSTIHLAKRVKTFFLVVVSLVVLAGCSKPAEQVHFYLVRAMGDWL